MIAFWALTLEVEVFEFLENRVCWLLGPGVLKWPSIGAVQGSDVACRGIVTTSARGNVIDFAGTWRGSA
jgi:hypothetical protein